MVAFTWSLTVLLTFFAFLTAIALIIQIHSHYRRLERYYESDDWIQQYMSDNQNADGEGGGSHDQEDKYKEQQEAYLLLVTMSARSMTVVATYTMLLATSLSLYGSTAIVGFTSLRGVYIAPCFSSGSNKMTVGIFGGAIVIFANLLLVCAVILGEVRVRYQVVLSQLMWIIVSLSHHVILSYTGRKLWRGPRTRWRSRRFGTVPSGTNSNCPRGGLYVSIGSLHHLCCVTLLVLCERRYFVRRSRKRRCQCTFQDTLGFCDGGGIF